MVLSEDPAILLLDIYSNDAPACNKDICSTMFTEALFITARSQKEPDIFQQRNGYRKCGTFTQWSTTYLLKNNDFLKFLGKLMELENIILNDATQSPKNKVCTH